MSLIIDVISRKTSVKQTLINPGDVTVVIYEPSVVQVHAQASAVARYVRDGNDLLIYMQDGTVIRCNGYFLQAANTSEQSELVFVDGQQLTHVTFADTAAGGLAPVELTAQTTAIESIAPYLDIVGQTTAFPWGWLAGAAVGGGALGALLASGGDDDSKTEVVNNPPPAEPGNATPSFLVTDNQGDQRGILSANDTTDDTTPTFSGSGQAGATIQIKDSNGDTIASTQVGSDGRWSVDLPTQSAGEHTWSVVQIVGSTITDAGSITLTIDNSQASVQVATTAGDNIINASEQAAGFTLSGTSSHLAQGTELTVTLNGKTYTTSVGANGAWSVQVPTADAQALGEGNQAVLVSGKDATGNTVTGVQLLTVDTQPPTLAINTIAQDNIISAAEHNVALVLSGTSNAEAGQTVTLTVNGKSHTATVGSDGTWQVTLPATEVQALAEGNYAVNASVSDRAGNSTSHSANFTVDTSAPVVSVNTVAGDDILNNAEQAVAQIISGQVSGASPGDTVTVKLGTHVLTGIVLADGSWNVALDPAVTRTLDRGANTIFVTVTDTAGNTGAASRAITLVGVSPLITINTVSGDDIISGAEKGAPLTLTGSTQQAETGQTVTVTLAGQSFTTTVQADGSWSLTVPAAAMGNLPDGAVAITASVTDLSGNTGNTSRTITVDSQAPALSIDPLTADNIINAAESGQDLPITGTTDAQPGQTVTVTLNGQTYQGVVQPDGTWSVTVPAANVGALADGNATVTASVNDIAGNPTSVSRVALVDATPPVVTINPVATDNVINTPEHTQAQIISGTVTGAQAGDIVTVTLNNVDYTTVVDGSGNWSLGVPASVVSGLVDGSYPINVSVTDRAGNTGSQSLTVTVNTAAPLIGINSIAGDDVINASEKGADLQITGTSDQPVNTAITVTLNGQNYTTTTDASGNWSVTVPASAVTALGQANYTVTAAVTSNIGNSNTASHNVLVDSALPGVTINPVATDDIINAAEAGVAQTISGQVTGAEDGDTVTITLGGNTYTATVGSNFTWSVSVPAADIQALGNGDLTVSASVTNQNGNTGSGTRDITIDANLPGLRVDTVAGDDVVNIIEHGQALVVTGSSSGLAEGTPLTVTINNVEYTTAVQADGSWSVGVTAAQVSTWPAGTVNIAVSGESSAGNSVSITHPVTVDLTPAAIAINTIATDDVINAAEKGADLTLSGTTTNVEPGQTVTVTFGGKNYTASVASDGSWTATLPAADLTALPEGSASAQASVSNINGNSASAVHNYSVDSSAPTIIINTVASDNIVNASEADAGVTVSGSTTAEAGQIVTVTLNSPTVQTYQATVQADGSWSINIPAADLEALTDGSHTLTATVNDKAGNPASTTHNLAVDLTVPVLTINTIAGDDIINAAEHGQALVISGSSTGGEAGDVVTVTLNSKTYTTTLDASGNWSVGVPAADVTALGSGPQTVMATVTDAAGNSDSETHTVTVNLTAPTIGINTIATDDIINATEKGADLQISGTSNQPAGTTITVTLNGQNYTATTDASGNWSTTVPASAVGALGEASYTVTANVTDSAGNSNSASHNVQVNTALPGVTINPVASDDIINAAESGVAQTISGQVTGAAAGDTVTVTLGGKTYTATVQGNLSWSVDVPAADIQAIGNGDLTVNASVTNGVGNTGSGSRDITIDANLPGLRVDTVAGDDVVNSIEHGQALVITGSSSGLAAGAALTVVINNVTYGATVLADGTWSLGVPAADVGNWPAGTVNITVSGTNTAGTTTTITHPVTVDLAAVAISINTVSGDDVINAAEKSADLTLSGSTSGVEAGQTVTVTFGGKTYTATVAGDGSWTTTVPAADLSALRDGDATVQASVSTINGNTASATHAYSVDATAPTLAINTIATDDILNAAEAGNPLTISGSSNAEAGQTVTVTLNGVTYTGTVQADGSWSVSVPTADLSNLTASPYTVSASVNDKAGNPATATHGLAVDLTVPVLTINTVSGDDIINAAEHGQALVISGSSTGGEAGDVITVTLNSKTYTTTLDASGNWSVGVPAADVTALGSGPQTITATITDIAGNSDDASRTVTVNLTAPTIGINTIASDDVINATEKSADLQITGTSNQPAGTTITVTLNGQNYTATTDSSGNWSATVPASAVSALGEASYTVTANVTDSAGNSNSASHNVLVNSALPAVTINAVATDDIINAAESGNAQTISGQVTGAAAGDTVTVTLGGNTYTATVQANLSWSVSVPAADIQAIGNGSLTVNASVTNVVGNTGNGSRDITIDANLPGLRVDTVAGDDVINSIEHNQALVITGSSSGLTAGTALTVEINNVTYGATVLADGTWSLGIPAADVSNWPAGTVDITVSGTNSAGTTSTITHPVTVDLAGVAITINTLSGDDVINAVEKGETLVVSGSTSGVEAGQTVTVTFGGKNYTTTVESNGSWTVNVPPADLAALPDGAGNVQASVSNINGNSAQADRAYSVDATAPLVTINTIASDDILNAAEAGSALTISGTSTAEAGQTVTVTLNGVNYSGNVQADGSWSVSVPTGDLANLTASPYTVSAAVSDKAGNPASATHNLTVDLAAPVVTINTVAGDDIINATEHAQAQIISGSATGATTGNTVSVTIGTTTYTTVLDANGNWSIGVPASVISALAQGDVTITATVTDSAGNSGTASHTVTVALGAPVLAINTIAVDDIINATEKGADLAISGSSNQPAGTQITVTLNGQNYTTTADASGNWSVTVPASRVSALGEATYTVTAAATDSDGNSGSASHNVQVNTALPGVTINVVATDDIINAAEAGVDQTISGQVTGATAGDTVTVTLGGATYTATVQANLSWSVDVPAAALQALGNGELTISASVTNSVGNTGNGTREITIDANLPGLRVDTVAGDDVVNIIEHGQALVITGSSSGLATDSNVTLTINGQTYVAAVLADGSWSVGVPAADVSAWPAGTVTITASGSTTAGNPVSVTHPVTVDLTAVAVSINAITADDVINAAEKGAALTLSGSTSGVEAGQTVTVTFGGKTYTASVAANGSWSTSVPAADMAALRNGDASAQASVSNVNGNNATTTHAYSVDASVPTVTINTIAGDDILNAAEAGAALTITGSSTAEAGQTVTVTLNGANYTGTVQTDGSWSISVPPADLSALTASNYTVSAAVSDKAGNPASVNHNLTVDTSVPVVTINTVAGDDVINATEHAQAQIISGSATGAATGSTVTVTIGTNTFTTVLDASGNWSVGVPASVVSALANGTVTINASVTDAAGNSGSATHQVTVNTGLPSITFNAISGDNVLNADEKGQPLTISGSSTGLATGAQVTVTLNGHNYSATTDAAGNWTLTVPVSDLAALGQANYIVSASATSAAGNTASSQANLLVDSGLPGVTINTVAGDDIINAAEAGAAQTISGVVTRAAAGDTVTVTLGGNTYTAQVQADLSWSVSVPAADLQALGNGDLTITASVTNANGNTGSGTRDITIDANLPGLRVDTVAGDDIVNSIEHGQALVITGGSSGLNAGVPLTITINGTAYSATVQADGSWSVGIPAANVSAWPAGALTVEVDGQSSAGNPVGVSHPFTVDLTAVAISISTVASDDVINAAEKGTNLTLSGSTSGIESGQTVTVTFGGKTYTASVAANGSWSVNVPAADLAILPDGAANVQASVSSASGNSASATHAYSVDASAPTLTINTIASDDILNATEAGSPLIISGTSTAETGQTVTVTLNGATYSGNVQADGSWSVSVPPSALGALSASNYTVSATVNDKAGNPGSASHNLAVDTTAPVLTINTVVGDDIINDAEHAQALVISGTSTGGEAGDVVSVVLNGKTYTTTLDASGNWSVGVPAADVAALGSGAQTITASVSDRAGNSDDASRTVTVSLTAPVISINTIAGDDVINATEKGSDLALSGISDQPAGTAITVTLNGQNYSATTDSSGNWSVTVPASAVSALGEASYSVTASVTNAQGNSSTASHNVQVNTALPGVTINPVTTDDIINAAEAGSAQTISGQVTGAAAGSTVTVELGGKTYTATVQADLSWNVSVPAADWQALGNGELTVNASVTNAVGNTGSGTRDITIDASLPGLRVDTVAGDDVVNIIEHSQAQVITGSSSGFAAGTALTVVINNQTYAATVLANGSWSVGVPATDVSNWPAGTLNITVSGANSAGTQTSITHPLTVDLTTVAVSINSITSDDVINAAEKGAALTLSGSTSGVEAGQTVTITFGGKTYTTTVAANGSWSTTVPAVDMATLRDGDASAQVRVTNVNGNSATATHEYSVDSAAPTVTINTIASDNIINASEAAGVTVSGTSTAETGQTLTVTLNGTNYQTTVQADGSWSLTLPASDLTALANNGYTLTASVSDLAGNPGSASKGVTVDTTAPVISFNTVAGDDVINNVEHTQAQIISGTATGAVAGDRLVVTIAGQQYVTSTDASGNWSVGVPASVISGLADGTVTISATITDSAGNSSTQTHNVQVNTAAVSLSVSTISGDNIINAAEAGSALTLSGTGTNFAAGTVVTVLLNGKGYSATIQSNGSWSVNVPAADVAALSDGTSYTVSASAQDSAGNSATASRSVAVDLTAPVISINTVSTDDRLNAAEQQQPLTLNGSTSAEVGQTVTVTFGGKTYTATVAANGTWALNVPAADLAALGQGAQTITASVNDRAGNPGQTTHALTVDTVAPTVTIATVAGDDIINNAEQLAGQTISGTTTAEVGQTVTVTFNGQSWTATVGSGGSWSVFIPAQQFAGLSDGSYTISATVSDQAGNPGSASRGVTLNGDVPSVTINTFAGDDVVNAAEHGSSLVISGTTTAPVGQTLTLTLNGKTYTTTVQTGGSWSYTLGSVDVTALADGNAYVINASVSNAIGNTGSSNHTITVDLSAPAMGINIDSLQADTGLSSSDFITSVSPVVVNGSLTAALASNETAQISIDGGVTWTTLTVTGTTWRYNDSRTLTDGSYLYQVRVIDAAGNVGATDSQNVVIDTIAPDPAVKTIAINAITTDTGLITNDFVTSDTTLAVSGTLGAALSSGEFAQISIDGGTTWQNLSVSGLTWTYLDGRTLSDGNYNYQVRVIDTAGNIGATASQIVTVDTTAPLASKTIAIAGISDDTGLSSSDFVTRDTTLTVRGTLGAALAADERAQISLDGGVTWTTLTVIGTSWSYADGRTLTDGTWNYTVRVVDLAGNVGQTATQNVVVDTTSPEAAKSITITGISDDTGASSSDFITSDTSLTVRGVLGAALGANEFAQISTDNGATWVNVTLAADGLNWSYVDGRTLTNGTTTWQVRVVDLAGNVGATSSQSAQIDTVNPAQVLTIASISTDTGSSATDFITSDTTLTLTGSLGAGLASGEVAQISLDGGATWITLTTNGTQWTYTDSRTLTDGSYVYQVRVLDLAGNTGPVVSKTVVVDTINPTATPTIVSYTDDVGQRQGTLSSSQATDDTTPLLNGVLSGPLASGEVVYLYRNGLLLGAVTMVGALNWTYSDSGLVSGAYTYSARVVDLAGNITASSDFVLTVDTSIPTTLAQITSQTTRDTTPIISGVITAALASGQYVEVVINGKTYTSEPGGAVVVDPAHNTWYVQLPDTDALAASATAYNVTAQVKSSAGNGNNANISNGTVTVNAAIDYTPTWTTASKTTAWGLTYGLDSHGMWTVLANQQVMQSTDPLTWSKTALTLYQSGNNYATSSIADYDRNGTGDLFITRDDYGTGYINGFTNNGDGTFSSAIQVTVGTLTWYGSIVAFDKEGDGYLDFWIGDAGGPDSNTFLWNNAGTLVGNSTTSNSGGSATVGGAVTGYLSLNEGSGVDLNNDGRIDLVQHTYNLNNYYTLSSLINQGNGTFVWGQNTTNTFLSGAGSGAMSSSVSMTWADFDGDGDMDLFLPASQGRANYGSLLFNTNGVLGSPVAVGATATTYASQFSVAVDWNHDGLMDIARIAQTGQSYLYTNVSNASNWTQSALGGSQSGTTSGVAAMDYDWDGAVDVLVTKQSGSVYLIRNTNTVSYGTSLHLRITDPNGINVYYGNTVKLYNSAGVLVATQIINPQSGMGVNDTSALVNFYGLNAGETYNAVLIKSTGTTASNIDQTVNTSWGGLQATDATHAYDLSAEAGTASNNGKFVGTGYNDTFFATAGTDTYDGSGGWVYSSGTGTWLANGGMDVVDFRLSTVGVTANLSSTAAQATGFNTSTFTNIEGISGSNFNDTLTGSSGDNQLEGRGGNDTLNIGNGGHDTLLYKLLNASDATGGNGSDVVNGFTVGTWEGTADTDRIDIRELLQGSGYTGNGKASYVNGVATLDAQAGNIGDFVKVTQSGSDTIVQIDRDGTGGTFAATNVVTLTGVHTDLATLLANHQLMVV
ncbi:Ig-like domain-containing protein [Escherichia coli]|nr:Ig-like domain-containing protein [Escherichia coli]